MLDGFDEVCAYKVTEVNERLPGGNSGPRFDKVFGGPDEYHMFAHSQNDLAVLQTT